METVDLTQDSDDNNVISHKVIVQQNSEILPSTSGYQIIKKEEPTTNIKCYKELLDLEESNYIPNYNSFECPICFCNVEVIEGVTLRNCLHNFCKECIANTIKYSEVAEIICPFKDDQYVCNAIITDREIKSLISAEEYEKYLELSLRMAENSIKNSFHCRTADCKGWCVVENGINVFTCPICKVENCLICKALHAGFNCKQYQDSIRLGVDVANTEYMLQQSILSGDAMHCPKCQIIIMKREGCDSIICSMCKTMICWVTKMSRWGPGGPNDITGGCKCMVNNIKCHPNCNNCH